MSLSWCAGDLTKGIAELKESKKGLSEGKNGQQNETEGTPPEKEE